MHVYVHVCRCVFLGVHIWAKGTSVSGQGQLFSYSYQPLPCFWKQSAIEPGAQLGSLAARPWHPPVSASLVQGLQAQSTTPVFYMDVESPNEGLMPTKSAFHPLSHLLNTSQAPHPRGGKMFCFVLFLPQKLRSRVS